MNWDPKKDEKLQNAIQTYLFEHNLVLSSNAEYDTIIDGVDVLIDGYVVLMVGLPPVSNYNIRETEYTSKYMRLVEPIAV